MAERLKHLPQLEGREVNLGDIKVGREFQPFIELNERDMAGIEDLAEEGVESSQDLITAHFAFLGVPGMLTLFRSYPLDSLPEEGFSTPLGRVRATIAYEDGLTHVVSVPVELQLQLQDIQLGHIDELAKYVLGIGLGEIQVSYIPCAGREDQLDVVKRQAHARGRAGITVGQDVKGRDVILPHSVSKLARMKAEFMERSQFLSPNGLRILK